jgi:hypothetical protein
MALILGCDANSQHLTWRSLDINPRELLEYLESTNLEIQKQKEELTSSPREGRK